VFRRNAISRESPVHQRQVGGLEPTVAREHVCGPDVISTATVNGAREGARVEIMSVGCPQTAGRASRSGQVPDYLSRNSPLRVRATAIHLTVRHICRGEAGASEMRPYQGGATHMPWGSGRLGEAPLPRWRISPCRRQPEGAATRGADLPRTTNLQLRGPCPSGQPPPRAPSSRLRARCPRAHRNPSQARHALP